MYLWIVGAVLVFIGLGYSYIQSHPEGVLDGQHEGDVRTTVAAFGNTLAAVSLSSNTAAEDIRRVYGPYVSETLLRQWEIDPLTAPGRKASNIWPDYIEVDSVFMRSPGVYDVTARIMLKKTTGDAGTVPLLLTVTNERGGYLISSYEEYPAVLTDTDMTSATSSAISIQETVQIGQIALTPLEILEDSRCPIDVACIQAGSVRVNVRVVSGGEEQEIEFIPGIAVLIEEVTITLQEVLPEKVSTETLDDSDYRFVFDASLR